MFTTGGKASKTLIDFIHSLNKSPISFDIESHVFESGPLQQAINCADTFKVLPLEMETNTEIEKIETRLGRNSGIIRNEKTCHLLENISEIIEFLAMKIPFLNEIYVLKIVKKVIQFLERDWNDFKEVTCQTTCHLRQSRADKDGMFINKEEYGACHGYSEQKDDLLSICYHLLESGLGQSDSRSEHLEKIYFLPGQYDFNQTIKLKEDVAIISKGTTGLSTWGASLYLLEYLSCNHHEFKDKNVVELGSGCGLMGLSLALLGAKHVLLTDVAQSVLYRLFENKAKNGIKNVDIESWNWIDIADRNQSLSSRVDFDLVVAADVVFDPALIPSLVSTISILNCNALIACTERNKETFTIFLKELSNHGLAFTMTTFFPSSHHWFCYQEKSPIHLIKL